MLISTLASDFGDLFSNMSVITFVCLLVGLILIIVEFFQPARGVLGISGTALIIVGIVIRLLGSGSYAMMFFLVFFCVTVILCAHMIMMTRHKKDWLTHSLALTIYDAEENKK